MLKLLEQSDGTVEQKQWVISSNTAQDILQPQNRFDSVCLPEVQFCNPHFPTAVTSMTSDITWYWSLIMRSWWILYSPSFKRSATMLLSTTKPFTLVEPLKACEFAEFKFLHSTVLNGEKVFNWPKGDDKEKLQSSRVFYGPVVMVSLHPFIPELSKVEQVYQWWEKSREVFKWNCNVTVVVE